MLKYWVNYLCYLPQFSLSTHLNLFKNIVNGRSKEYFRTIILETTTHCNRECYYCPNELKPKPEAKMSPDVFGKVVENLSEIQFDGLLLPQLYGEPLLDSSLKTMVKDLKDNCPQCTIGVQSNGDFFSVDKYLELVASGVDYFLITEHSSTYRLQLKQIIKQCRKLKLAVPIYYRMIHHEKLFNRGGLVSVTSQIRYKRCFLAANTVTINKDGELLLCCNDYLSEFVLGDLAEENLLDIWNSSKYRNLREKLKKGIFEHEICRKCTS